MYRVALLCIVAMVASCAGGITPDGGDVNPPDGGGVKPPDGGGVNPPDGGGVNPPDGGGVNPPDGGGVNPPDGGGVNPPDGGGVNPPDGGGVNPPDGGGVNPPDGGGGTPSTYKVSGKVSGDEKVGVALKLVGSGNSYEAKTDASGTYSVPNAKAGTYTLTPSLTGYKFFPATRSVTVSGAALTAQDFATVALGWKKRSPSVKTVSWRSTAMSGDAKFQVAAASGGHVYTSSDYGITWQDRSSGEIDGDFDWYSIAMSDDGKYLTAVTFSRLFTSNDFGSTWHNRTSGNLVGIKGWNSVAMSSDGKIQAAVVKDGRVYMSSDYGESWQEKSSGVIAGNQRWISIAMSGSGQFLAAVTEYNYLNSNSRAYVYRSKNSGDTWEEISPPSTETKRWISIAISDDGNNLAASTIFSLPQGPVYISKNSGRNWDNKTSALNVSEYSDWYSVAMSPNGQFLATGYDRGDVLTSDTSGDAWKNISTGVLPPLYWRSFSISNDGKFILGGASSDFVYTFVAP